MEKILWYYYFVELTKRIIEELRGRKVSNQLLNSFVHMFREKYNERD
ncbi:MAG: hypothetical protein Q7K45_02080 [Nanoarchaeota archaeon]|nr:hypothetical protein [Nanoarchaeota archaeon]